GPNIARVLRTSCANGDGIAELTNILKTEALRLNNTVQILPASWFAVKEELEEMKEATISLDDYKKLCARKHETTESGQQKLLELCDMLGTVCYFPARDKGLPQMEFFPPEIYETAILNPQWVTLGIYAILDDKNLRKRHGVITEAEMVAVLKRNHYLEG